MNSQHADQRRWAVLAQICAGLVLALGTWFSATAITPDLVRVLGLSVSQASWLTSTVQLGFVTGALLSSLLNLPDLVSLRKLMAGCALLAAVSNAALLVLPSYHAILAARFLTGFALAGVYPPALKLIASWFARGRGTALGAVIAALTLGSASPHLARALADRVAWQPVVIGSSLAAAIGALLFLRFAADGPIAFSRAVFNPRYIGSVLHNRPLLLANLGYFGHMWELYAMWGWFLAYAAAALPPAGAAGPKLASLLTFAVIASGVAGAVLGGILADRIGRTTVAAGMMAVSGLCAAAIGTAFAGPTWLLVLIAIVWGISVIGDSAQFSALATELSDQAYVGTAIALQLGLGFALTVVSIRLTPVVAGWIGWRWSFLLLVPGPVIGTAAMLALRRLEPARRLAAALGRPAL